nr:GNAT family N-acetyltransferase [Epibacterium ulvae]
MSPSPYAPEVVATWMANRSPDYYKAACAAGAVWIAELDREPVGYSQGVPGEILRLFVASQASGRGIGRGLMKKALAQALQRALVGGYTQPVQETVPSTTRCVRVSSSLGAVCFYQKWGFREVARGSVPGREALPAIEIVRMEAEFPL